MAEALYRKYRPQVFEDIVGQEPIERTLRNAISQDKVSHAYLFCGSRGTGKTTTARLLSKALLCEHGPTPDPDGTCEECQLVAEGTHPDVYELDAASRTGVDNVREEIISRVHFAPTHGRYKVYIIDEVHMLSTAAFNALLKTLEEPPSHVVFVLCTTDSQKVPETIQSRCQRFDFHRISPESMVARLGAICMAEDVEFEGEALDLIAARANGGLRDALTSLEQIIAFENGRVTLAGAERLLGSIDSNDLAEIISYIGQRDIASCFRWTASYVETGADLAQFARDMAEHVRNLYLMALVGDNVELDVPETVRRQLSSELEWYGAERAVRLLGVLGDLMVNLKTASNPRLVFEIALTRMVRPDSDLTLESLAERIEGLERRMSSSVSSASSTGANSLAFESASDNKAQEYSDNKAQESLGKKVQESPGKKAQESPGKKVLEKYSEKTRESFNESTMTYQEQTIDTKGVPDSSDITQLPHDYMTQASKIKRLTNQATMQRVWHTVMTDIKKQKIAHGVLFMSAKALFDEESGIVRIVFPAEASFAFNAVQKPQVQDALTAALTRAVGEEVPFRFEQGTNLKDTNFAAGDASEFAASGVPTVVSNLAEQATAEVMSKTEPAPSPMENGTPTLQVPQTAAESTVNAASVSQVQQNTSEDPTQGVFYDEVPYEDFDASSNALPTEFSTHKDEASQEDPAALQAILQASFGENVVLQETND